MSNVLLGTAVGDALGMPFESMLANNKELTGWDGKSYGGSIYHQLGPGQYTDDTQMSLMVAESLIEKNGFDPEDLSKRYVDWIESGRARGYGRTTLIAINNLKGGVHWSNSGVPMSYGNGTAMRAAPFGVYFRNDLYSLINIVKMDSAITHASPEAEAGALTVALSVYHIVNGDLDKASLLEKICPHLPDSSVKKTLENLNVMVNSAATPADILKILGTRADVRQTVPAVMYCYLKFNNFHDAVTAAIRAGGDTDTTAAIVGAMFGCRDGIDGIPVDLVSTVEDKSNLIVLDSKLFNRNNDKLFP